MSVIQQWAITLDVIELLFKQVYFQWVTLSETFILLCNYKSNDISSSVPTVVHSSVNSFIEKIMIVYPLCAGVLVGSGETKVNMADVIPTSGNSNLQGGHGHREPIGVFASLV